LPPEPAWPKNPRAIFQKLYFSKKVDVQDSTKFLKLFEPKRGSFTSKGWESPAGFLAARADLAGLDHTDNLIKASVFLSKELALFSQAFM